MQPTHATIEIATLQAVVQYLTRQPWGDVNGLIGALQQAKPVQAVPEAKPTAEANGKAPANGKPKEDATP
jgi:hypothetical protein